MEWWRRRKRRRSVPEGMGRWAVVDVGALSLPETWWFEEVPGPATKEPLLAPCLGTAIEVGLTILILSAVGLAALHALFCCGGCRIAAPEVAQVSLKNLEDALALYEIKVGEPAPDIEVLTAWVTRGSPILHGPLRDPWGEPFTFDPHSGCVGSSGEDRTPGTDDDLKRCREARRGWNASITPWQLPGPSSGEARSPKADRPSFKGL